MDDPTVQKALDLFSFPMPPDAVLPFITQKDRQRAIPKHRTKVKPLPQTSSRNARARNRSSGASGL
jgi:hypothetical protein